MVPVTLDWKIILLSAIYIISELPSSAGLSWLVKPQNTAVVLGQDLVLNCKALDVSTNKPVYRWFFQESQVQAKAVLFLNGSLLVPDISEQDAGDYKCLVSVETAGQSEKVEIFASSQVVLAYINDFFIHPQSSTVRIGAEVTLECVTGRSVPHPTVYWQMNGKRLNNVTSFLASFGDYDSTGLSAQFSMKLIYRMEDVNPKNFCCVAENSLIGDVVFSDVATVSAEVLSTKPEISASRPRQIIIAASQSVTLDCSMSGYPDPLVIWYKDGGLVNISYHVSVFPNHTLFIESAVTEDGGAYFCQGENDMGTTISNSTLLIVAAIGIDFQVEPQDTVVLAGHLVSFQCSPPISIPPATVIWYKDYKPFVERSGVFNVTAISSELNRWYLNFTSALKSDEGEYYCVARNSFSIPSSRTSRIARLTVQGAPVITEPPINTYVIKGELLHLICRADMVTAQSVYWTFLGQRILTSSTVAITNNGQELWISGADKSREGQYTCVVENSFGRKTVSAFVTVIVPAVTVQNLGNMTARNGTAFLLSCGVYGDPVPFFTWYHGKELLLEDQRRTFLTNGLFIDPVIIGDRGSYSCLGKNSGGQAWSNGTLDVTAPPLVSFQNKILPLELGQSVTLTCQVQGHPQPSVHWLHNETSIIGINVILSSDNLTLTLPVLSWAMTGNYTCVAQNIDGLAKGTVQVLAQVVPRVLRIEGQKNVDINGNLNLTCIFDGEPIPLISWFHSGERVQSSLDGRISFPRTNTLLIQFVQNQDQGRYLCFVNSTLGNGSDFVDVLIIEPPKPPKLTAAQPTSAHSVLLQWQHVFQAPGTDVNEFIIRYRERIFGETVIYPEKMSSLVTEREISGLAPGTEYVFTVSAKNTAGEGVSSNALSAITFESAPSEPRNLRVIRTTAFSLQVVWEVPEFSNGKIQQYQLQYRCQNADTDYAQKTIQNNTSPTLSVLIGGLSPYTVYELQVRAANIWAGVLLWGPFSPLIHVQTNISVPSAPPSEIRGVAVDPFSLQLDWQPVPKPQQHGPIIGYKMTYKRVNQDQQSKIFSLNSSQFSITIKGLSPWIWYSLILEAENLAGFGPQSDAVFVRTMPTAPSAPPQSISAVPFPDSRIQVTWQIVPREDQNCEISNFVVQYRPTGQSDWMQLRTLDNKTFSKIIEDVLPWTWYEIQVAAETLQLDIGLGPFSASVEIETLQIAASPVQRVSYEVNSTMITLSWLPSTHMNGVFIGYRVDYQRLPITEGEKKTLILNSSHAELKNLRPDSLYDINISTINGAGLGNRTALRLTTKSMPVASRLQLQPEPTPFLQETSTVMNNQTSNSSRNLPAVVAGSLTGVVIVLILIGILVYHCIKTRREHQAKYLIQDQDISDPYSIYGSSTFRQIDDIDDILEQNSSSSSSHHSDQQQQEQLQTELQHAEQQSQQPHQEGIGQTITQLTDTSWLAVQSHRMEGTPKNVYLPSSDTAIVRPHTFPSSEVNDVFTVEGVDNLGFESDRISLPGLHPQNKDTSPTGATAMDNSDKKSTANFRKRGRMRSESAAAIAVLRSATSSPYDDTDCLLTNDYANVETEVVFKQRTVL